MQFLYNSWTTIGKSGFIIRIRGARELRKGGLLVGISVQPKGLPYAKRRVCVTVFITLCHWYFEPTERQMWGGDGVSTNISTISTIFCTIKSVLPHDHTSATNVSLSPPQLFIAPHLVCPSRSGFIKTSINPFTFRCVLTSALNQPANWASGKTHCVMWIHPVAFKHSSPCRQMQMKTCWNNATNSFLQYYTLPVLVSNSTNVLLFAVKSQYQIKLRSFLKPIIDTGHLDRTEPQNKKR